MYDIIIIGGGFSGAYAALELAKDGYKILILDEGTQMVGSNSTSYNQCYKLHSGVHYFGDVVTARKCLIDSIICARQWSQFLLGEPGSLPRRNRHYIMSNSLFNINEARKVAATLSQTYADLIEKDPANEVFGDPKDFIKEVVVDKRGYVAQEMSFVKLVKKSKKSSVVFALDVGEPQVDIQKIREHLHHKITHTENITSRFNCEVTDIKRNKNNLGYRVTAVESDGDNKTKSVNFRSKGIVNCAWQNIELLNKKAGIDVENPNSLLIRMKISLLVKLPKKLENMDTCIFSLGPYCSVTNQYDGMAVLTYEPATNVGHYFQGDQPSEEMRYIQERRDSLIATKRGQKIARDIIEGCAVYVPELKHSQLMEIRVGYVKIYVNNHEEYSIYDKKSPIHRRREDGVIVHDPDVARCYISASGMKMTYAQSNAEKIRCIMKKEMARRKCHEQILKQPGIVKKAQRALKKSVADLQGLLNLEHDQEQEQFIYETKDAYERANKERVSSLESTLLKNPVTSDYFTPES